jgi:protein-tyrosine phosphatase
MSSASTTPALTNFSFVGPHQVLAGSAFPKGDPSEVVAAVTAHSFKSIVTLTEDPHPAASALEAAGARAFHVPVHDYGAPSLDQMRQVAELARDPTNQPMLVHCKAGIGRTGTMLAVGVVALSGQTAEDAIACVRSARPGSLEVPAQVEAVISFAGSLSSSQTSVSVAA